MTRKRVAGMTRKRVAGMTRGVMGFLLCAGMKIEMVAGMMRLLGLEEVFDCFEELMVVSCKKF